MSPLVASDRGLWLAGGVPERKRKRMSGVSGGSVDVALLQKLMADVGRDLFAGRFDRADTRGPGCAGASARFPGAGRPDVRQAADLASSRPAGRPRAR